MEAFIPKLVLSNGAASDVADGAHLWESSASAKIYRGIGNPNGVVTARGAAIYFDATDPASPVQYIKATDGVSNNEWV